MASGGFFDGFLERHRPRCHTVVKFSALSGRERNQSPVAFTLGTILHNLVLIPAYVAFFTPQRRACRAIGGLDIAGPVPAWIEQVEPAGKSHAGDFDAELLRQDSSNAL